MGFNNFIREYFTFNRRERNGVFVLLAIILLLILYLSFSDLFFSSEKINFSEFEKEIAAFEAEQKRITDSIADSRERVSFSGNRLVEDSENENDRKHSEYERKNFKRKTVLVELNSADTVELKKINGIGSVFAKRIVKFREALGGFVNVEQLSEVFGFDKEKYDQILPQVRLDTLALRKLNVNTASVDDMNFHPYLSKKEAVAIFSKRVKTGDYSNVQEVKKVALMSDSAFMKIAPYLVLH